MGRGAGPSDAKFFTEKHVHRISAATVDLGFLLERGYAETASLKVVGDHFQLHKRQRSALMRCSAAPSKIALRAKKCVTSLEGCHLAIDGFNLIILLEAAIGGGLIMQGADGTFRDLSSIHGSYKTVEQTLSVLEWVGEWTQSQNVETVHWYLDSPVSNSGKLAGWVRDLSEKYQWPWDVTVTPHVDRELSQSDKVVVTSDKIILNQCEQWANMGRSMIEQERGKDRLEALWFVEMPLPEHCDILQAMLSVLWNDG